MVKSTKVAVVARVEKALLWFKSFEGVTPVRSIGRSLLPSMLHHGTAGTAKLEYGLVSTVRREPLRDEGHLCEMSLERAMALRK